MHPSAMITNSNWIEMAHNKGDVNIWFSAEYDCDSFSHSHRPEPAYVFYMSAHLLTYLKNFKSHSFTD